MASPHYLGVEQVAHAGRMANDQVARDPRNITLPRPLRPAFEPKTGVDAVISREGLIAS